MPEDRSFFAQRQAVRALRHRDFRFLLAGTALVGLVSPAQFITQTFWVQDAFPERDVLYVSLMAGCRGVATLLFSLIGGAIADRFERRRVLLVCESASFALNLGVALLMLTTPFGEATIAAVAALTFFAAGNQAIDIPARTASVPAIVGMDDLSNAISLNQIANQVAIPITIPLASILNSYFDPGAVYAGSLVAWAGIIPLIAVLQYRSRGGATRGNMLVNIREGLRYTAAHQTLFAVFSLVFVIQVIGMTGPGNLGVLWVTDVLDASPRGFAAMAVAWGGGAVIGAMFFAQRHDLAGRGTTLCGTALLFGLCALVFAHSRWLPLTGLANLGIGFAIAGNAVAASSLVQHAVTNDLRGRVMGLFPLMNGLNMVATAPIGALAQVVGLEVVMPVICWTALAAGVAIIATQPALRTRGRVGEAPAVAGP
ncbi:MAG: MFS transporter [Dehalococcoidia bacterium]